MSAHDPRTAPLATIDVSRPELFRDDTWQPWFARLREESPVHFLGDSTNGAFWSVTSHALIKEVDMSHEVFSSETKGIAIVDPVPVADGQIQGQSFITLDEPRHAPQRQAVAPSRRAISPSSSRSFANARQTFWTICPWARPSTGCSGCRSN